MYLPNIFYVKEHGLREGPRIFWVPSIGEYCLCAETHIGCSPCCLDRNFRSYILDLLLLVLCEVDTHKTNTRHAPPLESYRWVQPISSHHAFASYLYQGNTPCSLLNPSARRVITSSNYLHHGLKCLR